MDKTELYHLHHPAVFNAFMMEAPIIWNPVQVCLSIIDLLVDSRP